MVKKDPRLTGQMPARGEPFGQWPRTTDLGSVDVELLVTVTFLVDLGLQIGFPHRVAEGVCHRLAGRRDHGVPHHAAGAASDGMDRCPRRRWRSRRFALPWQHRSEGYRSAKNSLPSNSYEPSKTMAAMVLRRVIMTLTGGLGQVARLLRAPSAVQ
jgi:hypothetical protein